MLALEQVDDLLLAQLPEKTSPLLDPQPSDRQNMAATSGRFTSGSSGVGASSTRADDAFWDYAVPTQNEVSSLARKDQLPAQRMTAYTDNSFIQNAVENGEIRPGSYRSPPDDRQPLAHQTSQSKMSTRQPSSERLRSTSRDHKVRRKNSKSAVSTMGEVISEEQESKWIHRDKLAQIESKEMMEMGIRVPRNSRGSRANSRTKSVRTAKSTTDFGDDAQDQQDADDYIARDAGRPPRVHSKMASDDMNGSLSDAADDDESSPRSRNDSGSVKHPSRTLSKNSRIHSRSGSRQLLDTAQAQQDSSSDSPQSPPRAANGTYPPSAARKASTTRKVSNNQRQRSTSNANTDSPRRPTTSNGSRPATARPEGDPPWLSSMYKPDPRLPPDEQMLPTHAKRMAEMQHQAEIEAYQREQNSEFTLLPDEASPDEGSDDPVALIRNQQPSPLPRENSVERQPSPMKRISSNISKRDSAIIGNHVQRSPEMTEKRTSGQWPLRQSEANNSPVPSPQRPFESPKKEQTEFGNPSPEDQRSSYNLMPPTANGRESAQRMSQRSNTSNLSKAELEANALAAPVNQPVRLQSTEEEDEENVQKKKGGCLACCVVM